MTAIVHILNNLYPIGKNEREKFPYISKGEANVYVNSILLFLTLFSKNF